MQVSDCGGCNFPVFSAYPRNLMLLQLDIETMICTSASCALGSMVGKNLGEFTDEQGTDLLSRVAQQVLSLEGRGLLTAHFFPFGNLELLGAEVNFDGFVCSLLSSEAFDGFFQVEMGLFNQTALQR